MLKPKMKMIKIKNGNKFIPVQKKNYITGERLLTEDVPLEDTDEKNESSELLDELLEDIGNIKSKRALEFFYADNKDYINRLTPNHKSQLLGHTQKKFFSS